MAISRRHQYLVLVFLITYYSRSYPCVRAYRGTVPIFPDPKQAQRTTSDEGINDLELTRRKVFSPKVGVKVDGLTKVFEKNDPFYAIHDDVRDLHNVSIDLHGPGPIAVIGGPTSGKRTFLRCLAGWERPDAGTISVDGLRKVVYIGRGIRSKTGKCIRELIREKVASRLPGNNEHQVEVVTHHIMKHADLYKVSKTLDKDLSGSEVYRFALGMGLARACASSTPPIFVLDGFFNKSISSIRHSVELILDSMQRELGIMVIFSASDNQIVMELARQVVDFLHGRITKVTTHEKSLYAKQVLKRLATKSRPFELHDYASRVVAGEDPTTGNMEG